jgi:hypothetical protein
MNRQPENGSAASFSRHSCARESMPFLPSMASTATRMRSCGVIWIRTPTPPTPGSASPDMKPKPPSAGFAASPRALPLQVCIREPIASAARPTPQRPVAAELFQWPACRFRSSHATCNSRAVRLIPSFRATSTAADQSSAGIRAFPLRLVLHSSKRTLASSRLTMGALLRGMVFLLAGKPSGRTTLTVIDRILHTRLPKTHRVVLFGATTLFQPDRGSPLPDIP